MNLIFVYGTLLKGQERDHILARSEFHGQDMTVDFFDMYTNDLFPLIKPGSSGRVAGEVYSVDDQTLQQLDVIEGHPYFYKREQLPLASGNTAWVYVFQGPVLDQKQVYPDDNAVLRWNRR